MSSLDPLSAPLPLQECSRPQRTTQRGDDPFGVCVLGDASCDPTQLVRGSRGSLDCLATLIHSSPVWLGTLFLTLRSPGCDLICHRGVLCWRRLDSCWAGGRFCPKSPPGFVPVTPTAPILYPGNRPHPSVVTGNCGDPRVGVRRLRRRPVAEPGGPEAGGWGQGVEKGHFQQLGLGGQACPPPASIGAF